MLERSLRHLGRSHMLKKLINTGKVKRGLTNSQTDKAGCRDRLHATNKARYMHAGGQEQCWRRSLGHLGRNCMLKKLKKLKKAEK